MNVQWNYDRQDIAEKEKYKFLNRNAFVFDENRI